MAQKRATTPPSGKWATPGQLTREEPALKVATGIRATRAALPLASLRAGPATDHTPGGCHRASASSLVFLSRLPFPFSRLSCLLPLVSSLASRLSSFSLPLVSRLSLSSLVPRFLSFSRPHLSSRPLSPLASRLASRPRLFSLVARLPLLRRSPLCWPDAARRERRQLNANERGPLADIPWPPPHLVARSCSGTRPRSSACAVLFVAVLLLSLFRVGRCSEGSDVNST